MNVEKLVSDFESKKITKEELVEKLKELPYSDMDFAKIDNHRESRTGLPEVIFASGKTPDHLIKITKKMIEDHNIVIATKLKKDHEEIYLKEFDPVIIENATSLINVMKINPDSNSFYSKLSKIAIFINKKIPKTKEYVSIATAGTSDIPIAEEAALTLEAFGINVMRINDIGVSGYHRVLDKKEQLNNSEYVIVLAGMEAALPSIISGLTTKQVLAVPTSVGYGASFDGLSALLGMVNSCAPGIAVFNIDNGFGAAYFAALGFKDKKLIWIWSNT